MQYDDHARRFNLATGIACGVALGAGLALLFRSARVAPARARIVEVLGGAAHTGRRRFQL